MLLPWREGTSFLTYEWTSSNPNRTTPGSERRANLSVQHQKRSVHDIIQTTNTFTNGGQQWPGSNREEQEATRTRRIRRELKTEKERQIYQSTCDPNSTMREPICINATLDGAYDAVGGSPPVSDRYSASPCSSPFSSQCTNCASIISWRIVTAGFSTEA
jgi:hypothetical protein